MEFNTLDFHSHVSLIERKVRQSELLSISVLTYGKCIMGVFTLLYMICIRGGEAGTARIVSE